MTGHPLVWIGFSVLVLAVLALDLGVFQRKAHAVGFKEALSWTGVWVTLAVLFGAGVWHWAGRQKGLEFFAGYLIEYSLSADNVFVFVLIFSYFAVPSQWQHKVLFWGVLGALVMRLVMIGLGVALIKHFGWILYVFGVFLLFTGIKMIFARQEDIHPERNVVVRWFRKLVPFSSGYHEGRFMARVDGRRVATLLLLVLVCVEVSRAMRWLEVLLRPRLNFLHEQWFYRRIAGTLIALSGMLLLLPLPIPLTNTLPALTVVLLAAGAMERDGLFFLAGCATSALTLAFFGLLAFGGAHLLDDLGHTVFRS